MKAQSLFARSPPRNVKEHARFVAYARSAVLEGDYTSGVQAYRRAISTYPDLAWMYRFNLNRLLSNPSVNESPVVVSMATVPDRAQAFQKSLRSVAFQADSVNVYLDCLSGGYQVPTLRDVNIKLTTASERPGLRDNGKFLCVGTYGDCYYFTVDDDIIYPPDYIEILIEAIERYGRTAIVGVHGIRLPPNPPRYFCKDRDVIHFESGLEHDKVVNVLGTGTVAFHSSTVGGFSIEHFSCAGMADVCFAIYCRERLIPLVAVKRDEGWLQGIATENLSLYEEFLSADLKQSDLVRNHCPWGNEPALRSLQNALNALQNSLSANQALTELMRRSSSDHIWRMK